MIIKENPAAEIFLKLLSSQEKELILEDSEVYYDYPIYSEENSLEKSGFLIVSKKFGILMIKCLDYSERTLSQEILEKIIENFEQSYSFLFSKLIKNKKLRINVNNLKMPFKPFIYLKSSGDQKLKYNWNDLKIFEDIGGFKKDIEEIKLEIDLDDGIIENIISTIEGSSALINKSNRPIENNNNENSKGRILDKIESQVALFDRRQKSAAVTIIDGPQRIRGLAGTGKTVVLTMKAAQIHLAQPDARILYTYYTKNLFDFIKRLITKFYREFTDKDPDWSKIYIMHAWGGENLEGTYSMICKENGIKPETFNDNPSFKQVCENLLKLSKPFKKIFDYSIIDEGQDYPSSFYKICRESTKNNRIIWAYDECQNIFNMEIQDTIKTFGVAPDGKPYIDFSKGLQESQDIVLDKCYRTPREILIMAFALGLGIYGKKIVQMPENSAFWSDLGFKIEKGNYESGSDMEISLSIENIHKIKSDLFVSNPPINYKGFSTLEEECNYVAEQIEKDISEGLLPEDISIISIDDRSAKSYFKQITKLLVGKGISTFNLLDASWDNKTYLLKNSITLTTVYRAKGNESGSVYIMGVDSIFNNLDLRPIIERNKLFVALTRTKAWVTITGMGISYKMFEEEIKKVFANDFRLVFKMPNFRELNIFKRDMAKKQAVMQEAKKQLEKIAEMYGYDKEEFLQMHLNF